METKYVRVPFDVEMAKKITNGECEGKIVTRNGESVRIVCWDRKGYEYPIIALIDTGKEEKSERYTICGRWSCDYDEENNFDLMLEIPEYMTFKEGDVIAFGGLEDNPTIGIFQKHIRIDAHRCYVKFDCYGYLVYDEEPLTYRNARFATEEEKQKLIDALKSSKEPKAKEYLKRFFDIELKQKYEFKPFDKVLVRDYIGTYWVANIFSNQYEIEGKVRYSCCGNAYNFCIPYNDQTKHLLGTTDNCEE